MTPAAICLFGGSFDPPHNGHVAMVRYALSRQDVHSVWVLPVYQHAFDKRLSDFDARMAMCQLAFGALDGAVVSDLERQLGGVSRTLRLVQAVRDQHPDTPLRLLVGADVMGDIDRWHRFDEIARIAPPLPVGRPGYASDATDSQAPPMPDVSSTEVRQRLGRGEDLQEAVPEAVARYVAERDLYPGG